jgi:hypothetical protein
MRDYPDTALELEAKLREKLGLPAPVEREKAVAGK